MTNKDRFLREGISVEEFAKEYEEFCEAMIEENIVMTYEQEIEEFLKCELKPTLTEDERVILNNLDKRYKYVGRMEGVTVEQLYIKDEEDFKHCFCIYKHLFLSIKERRRI